MNHYGGGMDMYNQNQGRQQPQQPRHDYYYDDDDKEEMQRLMMNLRKVVLPQMEQLIAYVLIPMIGSWIFKSLKLKEPKLPSVVNISFCRICRIPIDFWRNAFVKF